MARTTGATIDTTPPGSGHVHPLTRSGRLSPAPIYVDLSKAGLCSVPDNVASDENALRSTLNQQAMVINTLVHHLGLDLPDPSMHAIRHAFDRIDSLQRSSDIHDAKLSTLFDTVNTLARQHSEVLTKLDQVASHFLAQPGAARSTPAPQPANASTARPARPPAPTPPAPTSTTPSAPTRPSYASAARNAAHAIPATKEEYQRLLAAQPRLMRRDDTRRDAHADLKLMYFKNVLRVGPLGATRDMLRNTFQLDTMRIPEVRFFSNMFEMLVEADYIDTVLATMTSFGAVHQPGFAPWRNNIRDESSRQPTANALLE
ncbi:hypothetical protein HK105_205629 [Polyrhizophydium stewartii]|uniref:Uncharacterized protein n=1 Tax=Polyrhizophydium stewartii TaxID=2732419 RepID=A0ABR4N5T2_9FUNG